jgi:L,D-peptidoglycan transpeptidase YkuD (ErfK/YbiS/YcfS/YnhG family)
VIAPLIALLAASMVSPPSAAAAAITADSQQAVTVRVTSAASTRGVLEAWEADSTGTWRRVRGPVSVYVGDEGVGRASEFHSRTPNGVFTLTEAFGIARDPGSQLPYVRVGRSHWWVSDVKSRAYNTMRLCKPGSAQCGFRQSRSEQLGAIPVYEYAVVMDVNRNPVKPGRGSAFFLHVSNGKPTQGCISMPRADIKWLIRWLDPSDAPVISVGIGGEAYDVVR